MAQTCAPMAGDVTIITAELAEARLHFLAGELQDESHRGRLYSDLWRGAYAAAAIGQMAVTPWQSAHDRRISYIGTGSTVLGVLAVTLVPLKVIDDGRELRLRAEQLVRVHGVCAALTTVQDILLTDEADERTAIGWLEHTGNAVINVALGAFLAFGMHDKTSGVINAVGGTAIGEWMFATQPRHLTEVLRRYRAGRLSAEVNHRL